MIPRVAWCVGAGRFPPFAAHTWVEADGDHGRRGLPGGPLRNPVRIRRRPRRLRLRGHSRSQLRALTDSIAVAPGANHSVKTLAAQASLSTRQLTRLFQSELGTTPARYVEMIRIDTARSALDAGRSVADAARLAGFGSAETLRRVFVGQLGISPRAYRDRFKSTG